MPPRLIIVAVVLSWVAANGWLIRQHTLTYWRPGEPPPCHIDLTEEISSSLVAWEILQKDRHVGSATSAVERQRDRTYRLSTQLRFEEMKLPLMQIKRISTMYHINGDGALLGLSARFLLQTALAKNAFEQFELAIGGEVEQGEITPRLWLNQERVPLGEFKVPVTGASVVNPMQLLNRVPGLSEGRHWRMTLFDPIAALSKALPEYKEMFAAAESMSVPELHAVVVGDTLRWDNEDVPCYKIEYRKPGDPEPVATTWVRRRDGLVLQQFSSSGLFELTIRRIPNRS
jgi:hypothetical protein